MPTSSRRAEFTRRRAHAEARRECVFEQAHLLAHREAAAAQHTRIASSSPPQLVLDSS